MTRIATAVLAVAALLAAGCGGGSDQPVEGSTTPTAVSTAGTTTTPATTPATAKIDVAAQLAKLTPCVGGKPAETYKWFAPTVDYAKSLGGGGFTVTLKKQPITLIAFPSAAAAQLGFKDISDRLITLQQRRPDDYALVQATASQVIGNVLEVSTSGAIAPAAATKVTGCITQSTT